MPIFIKRLLITEGAACITYVLSSLFFNIPILLSTIGFFVLLFIQFATVIIMIAINYRKGDNSTKRMQGDRKPVKFIAVLLIGMVLISGTTILLSMTDFLAGRVWLVLIWLAIVVIFAISCSVYAVLFQKKVKTKETEKNQAGF